MICVLFIHIELRAEPDVSKDHLSLESIFKTYLFYLYNFVFILEFSNLKTF